MGLNLGTICVFLGAKGVHSRRRQCLKPRLGSAGYVPGFVQV